MSKVNILESREEIAKLDKSNMLGSIEALADQVKHAWEETQKLSFSYPEEIRNVVVIVFVSMFLAAALDSIVDRCETRKIPRGVSVIGIYIIAIAMLWREYRKGGIDAHMVSIGSAFLVAHLISLVTIFENPTSYLYFFFFMAFVNQQMMNTDGMTHNKQNSLKSVSSGLLVVVALVILLFVYSMGLGIPFILIGFFGKRLYGYFHHQYLLQQSPAYL